MDMKQHIMAALREQIDQWEDLLASLSQEQLTAPLVPSHWSTKDVLAHLWAWQQRTIARVEAARLGREPEYPGWPAGLDPEAEGDTDQINAWIYASNQALPWSEVHQTWKAGYQQLLEKAAGVPERDLLNAGRYTWFKGYPLAFVLLATYDHHQEHLEDLLAWLEEHGIKRQAG